MDMVDALMCAGFFVVIVGAVMMNLEECGF